MHRALLQKRPIILRALCSFLNDTWLFQNISRAVFNFKSKDFGLCGVMYRDLCKTIKDSFQIMSRALFAKILFLIFAIFFLIFTIKDSFQNIGLGDTNQTKRSLLS